MNRDEALIELGVFLNNRRRSPGEIVRIVLARLRDQNLQQPWTAAVSFVGKASFEEFSRESGLKLSVLAMDRYELFKKTLIHDIEEFWIKFADPPKEPIA